MESRSSRNNPKADWYVWQDPPAANQKALGTNGNLPLEAAKWVPGVTYSSGNFNQAKNIPQQIMDAITVWRREHDLPAPQYRLSPVSRVSSSGPLVTTM